MKSLKIAILGLLAVLFGMGPLHEPLVQAYVVCNGVTSALTSTATTTATTTATASGTPIPTSTATSTATTGGGCGTPVSIGVATPVQVIPYGVSTASMPNLNETWSVQLRSGGPMNCAPGPVGGGTPASVPSSGASGAGFQFGTGLYTQTNSPTSLQQSNAFLGLWCICQTGTCVVDGQWETGQ